MRRSLTSLVLLIASGLNAEPVLLDAEEHARWSAIGRVNQAGYKSARLCSGVLIEPDLVLTAAHCVRDALGEITFVAGWYRSTHAGAAKVTKVLVDPRGTPGARMDARELQFDTALLRLERPLEGVTTVPVGAGVPEAIIGYSSQTPHALTRRDACAVTRELGQLVFLSCDVITGTSGAPVLDDQGDVVAVVVARAPASVGGSVAVKVDLSVFEE